MKELYDTGDIVSIVLRWDGESFTIDDDPSLVFVEERINEMLGRNGGIK